MNYLNFNRKYVRGTFGNDMITLWEHNNGTVCEIEMFWEDNYCFFNFENNITLDVSLKGSVIKVGFHDEVRTRDLGTHPSWNGDNRKLLVKMWLRHILAVRASREVIEAVQDVVLSEFVI